jgi:ABC-type oligopeptide transport system substrate-binding subunit
VTDEKSTAFPAFGAEVAATLRRLGYRVTVKHYATDAAYYSAFFNDWRHIDAAINGWIPDYPAAGSFFDALRCPNQPYTCDPTLDRKLARIGAAATASGSNDVWTAFDREVAQRALLVPMFNPKANDFVSKRAGNYQHHPVFGLLLGQVWVR